MGAEVFAGEMKGRETAVRCCPVRDRCPLGRVCAVQTCEGRAPLYPVVSEVDAGEIAWADLKFEQRVTVIQSGAFSCVSNPDGGRSVPFSLFGCGDALGFAELYIPREFAGTYYAKALTPGRACSFPARPLRRHLDELPADLRERIIGAALVNNTSAGYVQVRMLSRQLTSERIVLLCARLRELARREGRELGEVRLTHAEIAELVASDRVSVSRALRKMEAEGLVELGYRRIRLRDGFGADPAAQPDLHSDFFCPPAA